MAEIQARDGGYDEGYRACPCFWGREPGSLIKYLEAIDVRFSGLHVLDVGCGEGKNAAYFAQRGSIVRAIDVSRLAIANATAAWPTLYNVTWEIAAVQDVELPAEAYDVVVAYGILHCLSSEKEIRRTVVQLQSATREGGYHLICAFNCRRQDLRAHPRFRPCLVPHSYYVSLYSEWTLILETDSDLAEVHPHNGIPHTHSLTRIVARKGCVHERST